MPAAQTESYATDSGGVQGSVKRAHFQACIGKAALGEKPPNLGPLKSGWVKDDLAKSLCAVPLPICACAAVISLARLSDVDMYLFSFLPPYFANVVSLTVTVIK